MRKISTCLWFDNQAEEAVKFYTSLFNNSKTGNIARYDEAGAEVSGQAAGSVMTISFQLDGEDFLALNGGPHFKINPSISFFVVLETEKQVDNLWKKLGEGGNVLMELMKYEWSEKYGWVQDKFGVSWQISLGKFSDVGQRITPSLLFTGHQHGRAEEAINFYSSIFKDSGTVGILHYEKGEGEPEGTVKHAQFKLNNQVFMATDSSFNHQFSFNEAVSFIINCESQNEVDYYWENLTDGGQEVQCGWLKDKFGLSWQVVPKRLTELLQDKNPHKAHAAMQAMLQMKKIEIIELEKAYEMA